MRPIIRLTLCASVAAAVAAPAVSASSDYFLKLGDVKGESAKGSDRHKEQIEIASWSWGETQAVDALTDGLLIIRHATPPAAAPDSAKYGAISGVRRNDNLAPAVTEKRQHGWVTVIKPLDRGAVRVAGKFPGCRVGAHYADAVLQTAAARFELKDIQVTGCAADGVTLNYASYRESPTRQSQK